MAFARVIFAVGILQCLLYCTAQSPVVWAPAQLNVAQFRWINPNTALVLSQGSFPQVWLSVNAGLNWTMISGQLPGYSASSFAARIHTNPANSNYVYVQGQSSTSWTSSDGGQTWQAITPSLNFASYNTIAMEWHPLQYNSVLACVNVRDNSGPLPLQSVYYSSDFGSTFRLVAPFTFQCGWGDAGSGNVPASRIYVINGTSLANFAFMHTDDFGQTMVVEQAFTFQFVFLQNFVVLGVYVPADGEVVLRVSSDISSTARVYYEAMFPWGDELENNGYGILDDATSLFVAVNHGQLSTSHWANLYQSDSLGWRFSYNFPYLAIDWPYFDFEQLHSLNGVLIANMVTNPTNPLPNPAMDQIVTYMSYNNGGSWSPLSPPLKDSNGNRIVCPGCTLNLHGYTSYFANGNRPFGPFYSVPSATGIVIATGNVGNSLSFLPSAQNTYLSRDGGLTWVELMQGNSIYEIGDQGGVIVLAPFLTQTTSIYYTLNEGTTPVNSLQITTGAPVIVYNIITDPTSSGKRFIVVASQGGQGVLIGLDFSTVFSATCVYPDDFEQWIPTFANSTCILGHTDTYMRKKPSAPCFVDFSVNRTNHTDCYCTEWDFECDVNFGRANRSQADPTGNPCVLVGDAPVYPPSPCPVNGVYYKTSGYRKIAGDTCFSAGSMGVNHDWTGPFYCTPLSPGGNTGDHSDGGVSTAGVVGGIVLVLIVLLVVAAAFAARSDTLREKLPFLRTISSWKDGYLNLGKFKPQSIGINNNDDDDDDAGIGIAATDPEQPPVVGGGPSSSAPGRAPTPVGAAAAPPREATPTPGRQATPTPAREPTPAPRQPTPAPPPASRTTSPSPVPTPVDSAPAFVEPASPRPQPASEAPDLISLHPPAPKPGDDLIQLHPTDLIALEGREEDMFNPRS